MAMCKRVIFKTDIEFSKQIGGSKKKLVTSTNCYKDGFARVGWWLGPVGRTSPAFFAFVWFYRAMFLSPKKTPTLSTPASCAWNSVAMAAQVGRRYGRWAVGALAGRWQSREKILKAIERAKLSATVCQMFWHPWWMAHWAWRPAYPELPIQSHEGYIEFLPALPAARGRDFQRRFSSVVVLN